MRIPQSPADAALLSAVLFPFLAAAAGSLDCTHLRSKGVSWDLSPLQGPKSVLSSVSSGPSFKNTTWTIDVCRPLRRGKDVPKEEQCPNGTRVCGIERIISKDDKDTGIIDRVIPVAGELRNQGGYDLDAKWERLKGLKSDADSDKEGLILELNGGAVIDDNQKTKKQKAVIKFLCDRKREGDEYLWKGEDKYDEGEEKRMAEGEDGEAEDDTSTPSLTFLEYDTSKEVDVLRLQWRTKYACEDSKEEQDRERSTHWGFFTWFIIILFLSTAAYLIFGSWLNYNRYGARGWDLLPHGDTIRDLPYLIKDWIRSALNTIQGSSSRGGYAAV